MRVVFPLLVAATGSVGFATAQPVQAPAGGDVDWSKAETIEIRLSNFKFEPAALQLHHGMPYMLRLTNAGSDGHNFAAKELFAASTVAGPDQANVHKGRIEVAKGETKEVRLVPLTAGTYKIKCTHFLHSIFGMKGKAVVD